MLSIPTLKLSYGNLLLARLRDLGSATVEDVLGDDPEQYFKSDGAHKSPERRASDCFRFAGTLGLAAEEGGRWALTEPGITYAENVDPNKCMDS
ncbi:hypothetical protein [Mycolicibacterium setense]